MKLLSIREILLVHSLVINESGGRHGVRDMAAILLLEDLPKQKAFGKVFYPSPFDKAAVYARTIIMNHPFVDGNKRSGMTAAFVFLEDNGFKSVAKEGEIERFAIKIIKDHLEIKEIAKWFEGRTKT